MLPNLYLYIFFYIFILFSTLGYGFLMLTLGNNTKNKYNLGYVGIYGILFLLGFSYLSNLVLAHGKLHNLIILILGNVIFFYFYINKIKNLKKEFFLVFIVFLILFIASLIFKTHDDFPYYHFPYSYYLTQTDMMIGVGQFNHGFRTPSSIFYINSLVYLPFIEFNLIHMPSIMIMGFVNLVLIKKIRENFLINRINFVSFYSLLAIIFINIFFYRIGEHGTDRSAQILIFLLVLEVLIFKNFITNQKQTVNNLYILMALIISLKAFYILYLSLVFPIIYYVIQKKDYKNYFYLFFYNFYFLSFTFIIFFVLLNNFFNTGCLIYPVNFSCISSVSWAIPLQEVNSMNDWYEQWSKAGAGPSFRVADPENYIKGFNWVNNWINEYFFTKVSDFILGIFTVSIIVFGFFYSKKKQIYKKNNLIFTYLILIILFLEWFYNHPALRYGGYTLISLLLFVPLSNKLQNYKNLSSKSKTKFIFLILLVSLIFISRNVKRIYVEIDQYNYKPLKNVFYYVDKDHYRLTNIIFNLAVNYDNCSMQMKNCNKKLSTGVKKNYGKYIFKNR